MSDSMRGLFFIVKGQYRKSVRPSVVNSVSKDVMWLGGYDPYSSDTEEWYMLMDNKTFTCVSCGSDLDKVLLGLQNTIVRFNGDAKKYFKHLSRTTSDDYYETHYLGHRPLTHEERVKKAEGRCPRVSPVMRCLYEGVYAEYGDFFSDKVSEVEERAYEDIKGKTKVRKPIKRLGKGLNTPKTELTTGKVKDIDNDLKETTKVSKGLRPKMRLTPKKA